MWIQACLVGFGCLIACGGEQKPATQSQPAASSGERRAISNGELAVTAIVPPDARLESAITDDNHQVKVHMPFGAVTISHYPKPCNVAAYTTPKPDADGAIKLLESEPFDGGYWVKLETVGLDCNTASDDCKQPRLAIETCSAVTHTVCGGSVLRNDEANAKLITALCKSISNAATASAR